MYVLTDIAKIIMCTEANDIAQRLQLHVFWLVLSFKYSGPIAAVSKS